MRTNKITLLVSIIFSIVILIILRNFSQTPINYNFDCTTTFGSKYIILILIFLPTLLAYGMDLLKKIDPRQVNYQQFEKYYMYL